MRKRNFSWQEQVKSQDENTFFAASFIFILTILLELLLSQRARASEKSLYDFLWLDPDKSVYVLQNKIYRKEKTFSVDVSLLRTVGNEFQDTIGADIKANYFLTETWGVEVFFTNYSNSDSDNFKNVVYISETDGTPNSTLFPFVRRLKTAVGAMAIWSPFYGKINTFNRIYYFDWSFGLGLANLGAESNLRTVVDPSLSNAYDSESFTALAYKTSFKFHVTRQVNFSIELRNFSYQAAGPRDVNSKELRDNWDFMVGVGYKF